MSEDEDGVGSIGFTAIDIGTHRLVVLTMLTISSLIMTTTTMMVIKYEYIHLRTSMKRSYNISDARTFVSFN